MSAIELAIDIWGLPFSTYPQELRTGLSIASQNGLCKQDDSPIWEARGNLPPLHTHLPANRDPTAVNTLPSRIPHATLITVHFTSSHITAIQLPPTLADAQLRELLVNATLSTRSSPHDNQLLTEDEVKATIAKREAWKRQEDESQKKMEEENRAYEERMRKFETNHPILFKLAQGALELFGWFLCEGFLYVMCILTAALVIYGIHFRLAGHNVPC